MRRHLPLVTGLIVAGYFLAGFGYLAASGDTQNHFFAPITYLVEYLLRHNWLIKLFFYVDDLGSPWLYHAFNFAVILIISLTAGALAALVTFGICFLTRTKTTAS